MPTQETLLAPLERTEIESGSRLPTAVGYGISLLRQKYPFCSGTSCALSLRPSWVRIVSTDGEAQYIRPLYLARDTKAFASGRKLLNHFLSTKRNGPSKKTGRLGFPNSQPKYQADAG